MISIAIPGFGDLRLVDLVCDFNGTLTQDGHLLPDAREALAALATDLRVHVVTADTNGDVAREMKPLPVSLHVIARTDQAAAKRAYVEALGADGVVAVGNGRNDREMVATAALGIAVLQAEGAAPAALASADVLVPTTMHALKLLLHPQVAALTRYDCPATRIPARAGATRRTVEAAWRRISRRARNP